MSPRSTITITKRHVDGMSPGQTIWDEKIRGFGVRCQVQDKSFVLKCLVKGRQRFITIGRFGSPWTVDGARRQALALLSDTHKGLDPVEARKNERLRTTVSELCSRYVREHARVRKKPRSCYTDERNIENHIIPLLGRLFVDAVVKADIEQFRNFVLVGKTAPANPRAKQLTQRGGQPVRGGPGIANRCLTLLSKMFNLAEEWGIRKDHTNPVRRVAHFREYPRDRFLSPEELSKLGQVLANAEADGTEDVYVICAIRLLIYTGARLGEVLGLKWEWVHLDRHLVVLPDSKTGQKPLLLSSPAVSLLQALPRIEDNQFVFPGHRAGRALVNIQKPWDGIRKAAGIDNVRMHDLRHTFASLAVAKGYSLPVIGGLLGHSSSQTTERYAHLSKGYLLGINQDMGSELERLLNANLPGRHTRLTD